MPARFSLVAVSPSLEALSSTSPPNGQANARNAASLCSKKIVIDALNLLSYHPLNTGKEVIEKFMSSNHSEVAET
jgi:hypothetical protein